MSELEPLYLQVHRLSPHARLPVRGSPMSAGYDLFSANEIIVRPHSRALVQTDIAVAIPNGYYGRIAPRSGLALNHFIDVGAGVIDADYRGPIGVLLFNFSDERFFIKRGDRIAQFLLEKIATPVIVEVGELGETARAQNGFGSTGTTSLPAGSTGPK